MAIEEQNGCSVIFHLNPLFKLIFCKRDTCLILIFLNIGIRSIDTAVNSSKQVIISSKIEAQYNISPVT